MVVIDLVFDLIIFAISGAVAKKSTRANRRLMMSGETPTWNWIADWADLIPPMKIAPGIIASGLARPKSAIVMPSKPMPL